MTTFDTCKNMGAGFSCVGNKCVECTKDTDCPALGSTMRVCKDNKCQVKCAKDTDCDPFYKCDTGHRSRVYSGCTNKLDCVSKTGNPLAACNTSKQCECRAKSDPECVATVTANVVNGQAVTAVMSGLQVCVSDHCVDVGCDYERPVPDPQSPPGPEARRQPNADRCRSSDIGGEDVVTRDESLEDR